MCVCFEKYVIKSNRFYLNFSKCHAVLNVNPYVALHYRYIYDNGKICQTVWFLPLSSPLFSSFPLSFAHILLSPFFLPPLLPSLGIEPRALYALGNRSVNKLHPSPARFSVRYPTHAILPATPSRPHEMSVFLIWSGTKGSS